jgi:hypothetical protein
VARFLVPFQGVAPALFVSNAPELIYPGTFGNLTSVNLSKARITGSDMSSVVRVFFWHVSRMDVPLHFAILVSPSVGTTPITIPQINRNEYTDDLIDPGKCLASAHLFRTLDQ